VCVVKKRVFVRVFGIFPFAIIIFAVPTRLQRANNVFFFFLFWSNIVYFDENNITKIIIVCDDCFSWLPFEPPFVVALPPSNW